MGASMKAKKNEKKLKKINKKLLKLSKKVKKLQKKKNKLIAKFKGVKKSPALKIINKEKINGGENVETTTAAVESTQSH
ncbi:MAG: hypothetical protein EBV81_00650 [Proteobacteria bacterium]|jgi:predicted transcriptional regulator|nr:hypothetical protein [Actinomycetota bacterium]NCX36438.1 hypothetical protein [Actinomycetota bacterium]NKA00529.1 hypothetical protein [Candidatus Fonsibacter sp. PEL5]NKA16539.1 hypothetical protein [Candidatus Fonsibacter sp. PEL55]